MQTKTGYLWWHKNYLTPTTEKHARALKIYPTLRAFCQRIDEQNKKNVNSLQSLFLNMNASADLDISQNNLCTMIVKTLKAYPTLRLILRYGKDTGRNIASSSR